MGTMTESALSDRSHIFLSGPLFLLQLALYRAGFRTMVYVDDLVLVGNSFDEALYVVIRHVECVSVAAQSVALHDGDHGPHPTSRHIF